MSANDDWPALIGEATDLLPPSSGAGRAAWHRYFQARALRCYGPAPSVMWLVQAKVRDERPFGPAGQERRHGLRLLRGLSKVHVVRFWRNASPKRVTVVGRHRSSGRYLSLIVETRHLFDFSVRLVRSPYVIDKHWQQPRQPYTYGRDREAAEAVMAALNAWLASRADTAPILDSPPPSAMGSLSQLYLKLSSSAELGALRERFPEATLEAPSTFASVPWPSEPGFAVQDGERLSRELDTELIYLFFCSAADAFQFTHCQAGRTLRHLENGMRQEQGLWECVRGDAQAWEAEAFFSASARRSLQSDEADDHTWSHQALRQFDGGCLVEGESIPLLDAREAARAAALHHQLSGWLGAPELMTPSRVEARPAEPRPARPHPLDADDDKRLPAKPWWRFW